MIHRNTDEGDLYGEVWKYCVEAPDYQVSNLGRVRVMINKQNSNGRHFWVGKIITQNRSSETKPYLRVNLVVNGKLVNFNTHRLVATAFVEQLDETKIQVNHIDTDPTNNVWNNLEWVTAKENTDHAEKAGVRWYPKGVEKSNSKLTEESVLDILYCCHVKKELHKDIAARYGLHKNYVSCISTGKRWNHIYLKFIKHEKAISE